MSEMDRRSAQEVAADMIEQALTATAGQLARDTPRQPSTAVPPEVVGLVGLLHQLADKLPPICERAIQGEVAEQEWGSLSAVLLTTAKECARQAKRPVIIDEEG